MNHGIWMAVALLAASPALGQDEASSGAKSAPSPKKRAKKGAPGAKGSKDQAKPEEGGSAAWGTGGTGKGSVASKKSVSAGAAKHAAERVAMLRVRSTFRYAVESCGTDPKGCDTALRDDSEHRFMDACLTCSTREMCEAERDQIRAGSSKSSTTLCSE